MTMATPIEIKMPESESSAEEVNSEEEVSNDPNIDYFLMQINSLKALAKEQDSLLHTFLAKMATAKEDCEKLGNALGEVEDKKKGISELFGSFEARQSLLFEQNYSHRSNDSSMFISTLDGISVNMLGSQSQHQFRLHKPSLTFIKRGLLYSHIFN